MADVSGADERLEEVLDPANTPPRSRSAQPVQDADSLLDMDEKEAAGRMMKDWDHSWKDVKSLAEQWKVNKARNDGYTGVVLVKRENMDQAHIPLGAKRSIGGMNKAARLKRRVRSVLFNDPPVPECTPAGDDDKQRDAAETGTRILQFQCSEGQMDFNLGASDAFDLAGIYGSGFLRFWVDETGGGWLPKQIEASPEAVDPNDPFPIDPMTGQKKPCDPILRYVTEDGQFTEDRTQADRAWVPKLRREVLTGKHVRFIPYNVRDLWEADGVMVGCAIPLGTLKKMFPDMKKWDDERMAKVADTRPQHFEDLVPQGRKNMSADPKKDDTLVFVLTRYHVQSPMYPEGAYLMAAGDGEMLFRDTWFDKDHAEPLDIPLTQFKQMNEEDNPYGDGLMSALGPGNELRAAMWGAQLEHLDRFNNRKIFVPLTSALQAQQLASPTGTPIPILPGGEPRYEEIPDFPPMVEKMLGQTSAEMDDESGLQQGGQGMNQPSVQSGKHANAIWEQVQMGLSDLRDATERGLVRGWRIMMQLDRAFFSEPQLMRWRSPDGRFKLKRWTGADFADTTDVRVQKGSFSLLTPTAKAELAVQYSQMGILKQEDLEHVIEGAVGGMFGLQDNPHRNRVRLQIAKWEEGPPEGWMPQQPQMDPMTGQPAIDPQSGQPLPPPPDPILSEIFDERPTDTQPDVAGIRVYELGRTIDKTGFKRWPPEWSQSLVGAYQAARQAAQVMDAETSAKMQEELAKTKEKANEKPNISLGLKAASDLDSQQVAAFLQQAGIQLPPPMFPDQPPLSPLEEAQVDITKHRISAAAGIGKQVVKGPPQPAASGSPRQ